MSDYTLTQREYTNLKSRLTRARNTKDPDKILKEVLHAEAIFRERGWPDSWANWEVAKQDALIKKQYGEARTGLSFE